MPCSTGHIISITKVLKACEITETNDANTTNINNNNNNLFIHTYRTYHMNEKVLLSNFDQQNLTAVLNS